MNINYFFGNYIKLNWLVYIYIRGAKTGAFWDNLLNTMTADGLAPCVTTSSGATTWNADDKRVTVLYKKGFQLSVSSKCWEVIRTVIIILYFLKKKSAQQWSKYVYNSGHQWRNLSYRGQISNLKHCMIVPVKPISTFYGKVLIVFVWKSS